ncbi:MAG TPA: AsmA-like C-terminal region-containing protein [Rhodopila sp.]|nr:AsmA-like C-terminal region-containing protein [Rhodopila sp.]
MRPIVRVTRHSSQLVHRLLHIGLGLCVIFSVIVSFAAWRLAQGPIDVSWLSNRAREALLEEGGPVQVSFGDASLAWGGVGDRLEHLLELRVSDVAVRIRNGEALARAPHAWMTFSIPALLAGRFVPRTIEITQARITIPGTTRSGPGSGPGSGAAPGAGSSAADPRTLARTIAAQVNGGPDGRFGVLEHLVRVRVRDSAVDLLRPDAGPPIAASAVDLDLVRPRAGHLHGSVSATLSIGPQRTALTASIDLLRASDSRVALSLTSFQPSGLGTMVPFAAGIDVPVSLNASLTVDRAFQIRSANALLELGSGHVRIAQGSLPVRHGTIELSGTADTIDITHAAIDVAPTPVDPPAMLRITGTVQRKAKRLTASTAIGLDNVNLAELPLLWPAGVGGGARPWVMEHVLSGTATHGAASISLETDQDLRNVVMTRASGTLDGTDVAFTWLDSMPPVQQAAVHLRLLDPDSLDIHIPSARQTTGTNDPDLLVENGIMHITGLSVRDQLAAIRLQTRGPVTSALALLKQPRLHLLSEHPISFSVEGGDAAATLDFQFPMDDRLQMDDVTIHANAHLTNVRVPAVVSTNAFDKGVLDLSITKDGLRADGQGLVAAIPVKLQGTMDFTAGPPTQVVQRVVVTGQPTAFDLRDAGFDLTDIADGTIPMTITILDRRTGGDMVSIEGDLTETTLTVSQLGWTKPRGTYTGFSAGLSVRRGQLAGIERFAISGTGVSVGGSARATDGRISSVSVDELRLGNTTARGTVQLAKGLPLNIVLSGDRIDLSTKLAAKSPDSGPDNSPPATKPSWILDARFATVLLANDVRASNMLVKARGNGEAVQALDAIGTMQGGATFSMKVQPKGDRRLLRVESGDAGALLRGLDVVRFMQSGRLVIDGEFGTLTRYHPLTGRAVIEQTRVAKSPALGKVLQAVTIYGLADVVRGPGMGFSKVDIPFTYDGNALNIRNGRAYNASLGLTARGWIDTRAGRIDLDGTIVPAYFFNAILGGLPLVGKLFSPEKGGGVFAVAFSMTGDLNDPSVSVNPITALTPGFLRNMFGKQEPDEPGQTPDGSPKHGTPAPR